MTYRSIAMVVARLADAGNWPLLLSAAVQSVTQDYSWAPGLVPGLLLAATEPTSRAIYTFALLALYAAPAAFALAILARDCARRAGLTRDAPPTMVLALGAAAVFVAYPAAMAVAARGMPDVGGLVLVVCALKLAERLARLLALRQGLGAHVEPMIRRVALALALTLYAMFVFRRWYAFAAAGIVVMLALELGSIALKRGARFRWKDAVTAAAIGALTLLALLSPVLIDWAPNFGAHDYAQTYAGYRKPPDVFVHELGDWVGLIPALFGLAGAAFLWARSRNKRASASHTWRGCRRRRAVPSHPDALHPPSRPHRAGDRRADRSFADDSLQADAAHRASRRRRAWRDHALAIGCGAQSARPRADRRIAASAARRPRRTQAPQGLGRRARAARRQGLRARFELYVQRPAHRRVVAAPAGAGPDREQARASRCPTSTPSTGRRERA